MGQTQLNNEAWSDTRKLIDIDKIKIHDKYDGTAAYYDIGIIFVNEDIVFKEGISPICLPDQPCETERLIREETSLVGWGKHENTDKANNKLSISLLQVYAKENCNKKYDIPGESKVAKQSKAMLPNLFTEQAFCAGSEVRMITHRHSKIQKSQEGSIIVQALDFLRFLSADC